jgi:NAD(P)-dependent dehydrogenase (short-subunit alcohol dehydrogenase family)
MTMDMSFAGKRVFVSGADQPIGAAAATAFVAHGARVAVHGAAIDGAATVSGDLSATTSPSNRFRRKIGTRS